MGAKAELNLLQEFLPFQSQRNGKFVEVTKTLCYCLVQKQRHNSEWKHISNAWDSKMLPENGTRFKLHGKLCKRKQSEMRRIEVMRVERKKPGGKATRVKARGKKSWRKASF